jgi:hypothetical protein
VAQPADSPITAHTTAAAAIHRPLPLDRNRDTPCRGCSAVVAESDKSGEFGESGEDASWEVAGSWLFIMDSSDVACFADYAETAHRSCEISECLL